MQGEITTGEGLTEVDSSTSMTTEEGFHFRTVLYLRGMIFAMGSSS